VARSFPEDGLPLCRGDLQHYRFKAINARWDRAAWSLPFLDGVGRGPKSLSCMRASAFIEPCLPSPADRPPSGSGWVHEIKLDGFRMMVRRDPAGVRLLTRNGYDWTGRFPLIVQAAAMLRARSFLIDGEAVACDGDGLPVFDRLRYRRQDGRVFLFAFDLLEFNGQDMRREPLERRKRALAVMLRSKAGTFSSMSIATICRQLLYSATPASSASRASSASGLVRPMSPVVPDTG
jgi:ATP-dependent DNA ligase